MYLSSLQTIDKETSGKLSMWHYPLSQKICSRFKDDLTLVLGSIIVVHDNAYSDSADKSSLNPCDMYVICCLVQYILILRHSVELQCEM